MMQNATSKSTMDDLLVRLRKLDVRLSGDGERLHLDAPEGVLTEDLRSELTHHKLDILAFLKAADSAPRRNRAPLTPASHSGPFPLTFSQEALWFLDQMLPLRSLYNLPLALRLRGPLDADALQLAIEHVLGRHEALRTAFLEGPNGPQQVVRPARPVELKVIDVSDAPAAEREARMHARAAEERRLPFDLSSGLLLRAVLFRLDEDDHALALIMHHIVSDERSIVILGREVGEAYQAITEGMSPGRAGLPSHPVRFTDFAVWQREHLTGDVLTELVGYWRQRLAGTEGVLDLPTDRRRTPAQTYRGARENHHVPAAIGDALRDLGRAEGCTLFMTLLAAFYVLLHRYTSQDDLTVGSPIAGRTHLETEPLVGYFVNMLVLRARVDGGMTFRELLRGVREVCLGAYSHQELPFEKLVEALQPQRDLSRNPFFQVMFDVLQDVPESFPFGGLDVEPFDIDASGAKFDLSLSVVSAGDGLRLHLDYFTDLFDAETVRRMLGHYEVLLRAVAASPDAPLAAIDLLAPAERRTILTEWNDTYTAFPQDRCIQQLFEEQVEETPDAPALAFQNERLTYAELNERVNKLAHHLRRLGVGPEVLVGVHLGRSLEMVIALLGILKAGGAYVPLDPEYPAERLAYMIGASGLPLIISTSALAERIPAGSAAVLQLDAAWSAVETESGADPVCTTVPQNLAYVLYTSGSTGQPKGVAIQHRNAAALLDWARQSFSRAELAGVLASTSICFDLAVYEIFTPLICGGTVIVAENVLHLPSLPATTPVTLINTVPSAMTELLRTDGVPPSVRTVNLAGEPLLSSLVEASYRVPTIERVYNLYGPTEDTTYSTGALIARGAAGEPTIGRPLANKSVYLLDRSGNPVPRGVVGEVYIGGAGVARGYLGQPDMTAAKFVPDPFGDEPGARLYRTGDLARHRADGSIEFLGRADHQIKIRGFRIELPEIEATLRQHPAVGEAVVVVRDEPATGKRLIAYVVPKTAGGEVGDLRPFLKAKLPAFMVPAAFVTLAAMPLTPNGKIDRRALPAPERPRAEAPGAALAAASAVERSIAEIWQQLLGIEQIGVQDNFFDLGGHSLLLLQMRIAVRDKLGKDVSVIELFRHPTVRALADYVSKGEDDTSWNDGIERGRLQRSAMNRKRRMAFERE
jgi:amino acid adenylation domain-containing protein